MNELANATTGHEISVIDGLAMQARTLRMSIEISYWQLARVFAEAKELVPHGGWAKWVEVNADVSQKTADDMIESYKRFAGRPQFEALGRTKITRLLPLPPEAEEDFMATHDVAHMSSRQIQEAVKKVRAEAQAEIDAANKAARDAERRAIEAENRPPEVPEELTNQLRANDKTIRDQQDEIDRLAGMSKQALTEKQRIIKENNELRRDLRERDEDMEAMQADLQRAQDELLNLQSAQARGDTERQANDTLTPDVFSGAVNTFIGTCCRLPQMGRTFAAMSPEDKERYDQSLRALERWAESARLALNTITYGEAIVID